MLGFTLQGSALETLETSRLYSGRLNSGSLQSVDSTLVGTTLVGNALLDFTLLDFTLEVSSPVSYVLLGSGKLHFGGSHFTKQAGVKDRCRCLAAVLYSTVGDD
jgi:hypothetical protein